MDDISISISSLPGDDVDMDGDSEEVSDYVLDTESMEVSPGEDFTIERGTQGYIEGIEIVYPHGIPEDAEEGVLARGNYHYDGKVITKKKSIRLN
jgi:hypothetical protein